MRILFIAGVAPEPRTSPALPPRAHREREVGRGRAHERRRVRADRARGRLGRGDGLGRVGRGRKEVRLRRLPRGAREGLLQVLGEVDENALSSRSVFIDFPKCPHPVYTQLGTNHDDEPRRRLR